MRSLVSTTRACLFLLVATSITAAQGPGFGRGGGRGFGRGAGGHGAGPHARGQDERHQQDHAVFQFLLSHHKQITRTVTELKDGVQTLTESTDPEVSAKIKEHVQWMD